MKEIKCEKRGAFVMFFAYHPDGERLYTGCMDGIIEATKDEPTHHGFMVGCKKLRLESKVSKENVIVLGRNSIYGSNGHFDSSVSLIHDNCHFEIKDYMESEKFLSQKQPRSKFYLFFIHGKYEKFTLLHQWRRLPKRYLTQFGEIDKVLDAEDLEKKLFEKYAKL